MAPRPTLFDRSARRLRRIRAARLGDPFLHREEIAEAILRLDAARWPRGRLLIIGALAADIGKRVATLCEEVVIVEPGLGSADEDAVSLEARSFDAALCLGSLDTLDRPQDALRLVEQALAHDRPVFGFLSGGETLPGLREALLSPAVRGTSASPRTHPTIRPADLSALLTHAGFLMPVVDVQRVAVRYSSLDRLVGDLRAIAATNQLAERDRRYTGTRWKEALAEAFGQRTEAERFEWLHFTAWSSAG